MTSALLVMDVQRGVAERFDRPGLLDRIGAALAAARNAGVPVIFVRVAFRPGFPEVSAANLRFSAIAGAAGDDFAETSPATSIHPALAPRPGEPVVLKKRVSAFAGSDLEVLLRSMNVTDLVLCGIATSGVVLSTLREAADRDYRLTVLADCCADADEQVHRILLEQVFPRQAAVTTAGQWAAGLAGPAAGLAGPAAELAPPRCPGQRRRDTLGRLAADADVWVATADESGAAYLVPLSFLWDGRGLVVATPRSSVTGRNLGRGGRVRVGLGELRDVTMIDGTAEAVRDTPTMDAFAAKHAWDPRDEDGDYGYFRIVPERIQAWREVNELPGRTLMRDGQWRS